MLQRLTDALRLRREGRRKRKPFTEQDVERARQKQPTPDQAYYRDTGLEGP